MNVETVREPHPPAGRVFLWIAGAIGALHAASSLYWAFGGRWLLETVGQWAMDLSTQAPVAAALSLGLIAIIKLLAAAIPIAVAYGLIPWRRFWRAVSWTGGVFLIGYGGANVVVSGSVLAGFIRPEGGYDADAMIGHALIWDPLFLAWGLALVASLWMSRRTRSDRARPR